ncbi:hypothetical protein [Halopiger goleimassiliensis]|uniref:hypothetical protein n=1 Tax=Halopiger goleimassiliensis TaxID=1293048 RepID=UPI0006782C5A|nr:hypothetical protein [Halopiger goleimassiliensis]
MGSTREHETDSFEESPITPTRLGAAAAVMDVVVFAAVGHLALDDVAIGGIAGLLVGIGVFCFLPLFVHADGDGSFEELASAGDGAPLRAFHRLAAGFALSAAGLVLLATGFAELEIVVGLPAALAVAVAVYLVAGFALPNARVPR